MLKINPHEKNRSLRNISLSERKYCMKPSPPNNIDISFTENNDKCTYCAFLDFLWFLYRTLASDKKVTQTWAAFNSLFSQNTSLTSITTLPLVQGTPTDWSNLYSALKVCQSIATSTENQRLIISLDLQLYAKALQLKDKKDINSNFIFRLGELRVVFAFLKTMGKYIENSGLDQVFIESGIYGPTTLNQVVKGKHMKRCLEAYMYLYLALFKLYTDELFRHNQKIPYSVLPLVSSFLLDLETKDKQNIEMKFNSFLEEINQENVFECIQMFDKQLEGQAKFYRNFMFMYEALLLFIRASRQRDWILHLNALHQMIPYFFAHDQLNYARLSPVYLSEMAVVQESEPEIWNLFMEGNFSVQKNKIPFTAIGADHALEQENKNIKVLVGVKGLLQNDSALVRFGLISPVLNQICEEFYNINGIEKETLTEHYQLTGSTNERITNNTSKLLVTLENLEVTFEKEHDDIYNIVTKSVLLTIAKHEILSHFDIGQ